MRGVGGQDQGGPIRAVGGPTANALWMQIKAEMLGRPIEVYECPHAAAWGAAFLAWLHLRGWSVEARGLAGGLRPRARYTPSYPETAARLRRSYELTLHALARTQAMLLDSGESP
jgi:sugar (pentulose or hexulose) kinase